MPEIFGVMKSCNDDKMIIVDEDHDEITISNLHVPKEAIQKFKTLTERLISYYYDDVGIICFELNDDDLAMSMMPDGERRTIRSLNMQLERDEKKEELRKLREKIILR